MEVQVAVVVVVAEAHAHAVAAVSHPEILRPIDEHVTLVDEERVAPPKSLAT